MVRGVTQLILILFVVETARAALNYTLDDWENELMGFKVKGQNLIKTWRKDGVETRRQGKKSQSTSSSGVRGSTAAGEEGSSDESLVQSFTGDTSTDTDEKKRTRQKKDRTPKSTEERKGWRKWHRKCTSCPEDMHKRWRDPTIKWICGAYQRARRTFKSLCMMHYRNCQDGTMFTKIADHRCPDGSGQVRPYNEHFFYDYKVVLTGEESKSGDEGLSAEEESSSSSWSESTIRKLPPLPPQQ